MTYLPGAGGGGGADLPDAQSWTPVIKFGGNHVGQTYDFQDGSYYYFANGLVIAFFFVQFSEKGSSTGNASVSMPASANGSLPSQCQGLVHHFNLDSGVTQHPRLWFGIGEQDALVVVGGAGSGAVLQHTDFTDTTTLYGLAIFKGDLL